MIDHIGIEVSDYQAAVNFYKNALAPLGYELLMEVQLLALESKEQMALLPIFGCIKAIIQR